MYWDAVSQVTGSDVTTTNLTATNITGLTFPASANRIYEVELVLSVSSSNASGTKYTVGFSAAGAVGSVMDFSNTTAKTAGLEDYSDLGTLNSNPFLTLGGSTRCQLRSWAVVSTGANSGNITAQHAKVTSGTSTVYVGSVMKVRRLL